MNEQRPGIESRSRRPIPTALRDLIFVGAVTLFALLLVRFLNVSGSIDWLVQQIGVLGLHDVVLTSIVVVLSLALYSFRRWREASRAENELHLHHEKLEEMVEKRTADLRQINEELEEEIAERKLAEVALRESEDRYRQLFERDPNAIVVFDAETLRIEDANPMALDLFGYSREEFFEIDTLKISAEKDKTLENMKKLREGGEFREHLRKFVKKDGTVFPAEIYSGSFVFRGRRKFIGTLMDISERRRAEEAVRESEKFLDTIFHSIHDPFSIIDRQYRIVRVNEAYAQMRGKPPEDLLGAKCHEILREKNIVCEDCIVEKTFISSDPCAKEKSFKLPGLGGDVWIEIFTHPIVDLDGNVSHVVEYIRDITDRKKADVEKVRLIKKLEYISRTDALTGLLNRRAIIAALGSEVERAKRYGIDLSLLLCDIDFFKDANDAYGHDAGDKALVLVAGTLCGMARTSDLIGRYGGDEFMLILPETGIAGAIDLAKRMLSIIKERHVEPFEGGSFGVSLSVGVTGLKPDRDDADALIKRADKALYTSKRSGRGRVSVEN